MKIRFWITNFAAQLFSFFISWILVTYVFEGATPYIQSNFKANIINLPMHTGLLVRNAGADSRTMLGLIPKILVPPLEQPASTEMAETSSQNNSDADNERVKGNIGVTNIPTQLPTSSVNESVKPTDIFIPPKEPWDFPVILKTPIPIFPTSKPISPTIINPTSQSTPTNVPAHNTSVIESEIIYLINNRRRDLGLNILSNDSALANASEEWSNYMSVSGKCGHDKAGFTAIINRAKKYGYQGVVHGETVACSHSTAASAVEGWWNSPPHKAILTNSAVKQIGVATIGVYHTVLVGY